MKRGEPTTIILRERGKSPSLKSDKHPFVIMCVSGKFKKKLTLNKAWKYIAYCLLTRYYFCKRDYYPLQPDYRDTNFDLKV